MRSNDRRLKQIEARIRSRSTRLELNDGSEVWLPGQAPWIPVFDAMIEQLASEYEGEQPPEPTEEARELGRLYANAVPQPTWGRIENGIADWSRDQFGDHDA